MKVKVKVKVTAQLARKDERCKMVEWLGSAGISMPSPEQETPDLEPQSATIIHQPTRCLPVLVTLQEALC